MSQVFVKPTVELTRRIINSVKEFTHLETFLSFVERDSELSSSFTLEDCVEIWFGLLYGGGGRDDQCPPINNDQFLGTIASCAPSLFVNIPDMEIYISNATKKVELLLSELSSSLLLHYSNNNDITSSSTITSGTVCFQICLEKRVSLLGLFNLIRLNENAPIASAPSSSSHFVKVFSAPCGRSSEDIIKSCESDDTVVWIYNGPILIPVRLNVKQIRELSTLVNASVTVEVSDDGGSFDEECKRISYLLSDICQSKSVVTIESVTDINVTYQFTCQFTHQSIADIRILNDIILNDTKVNKTISVDEGFTWCFERRKRSSKSGGTDNNNSSRWIIIDDENKHSGVIKVSLTTPNCLTARMIKMADRKQVEFARKCIVSLIILHRELCDEYSGEYSYEYDGDGSDYTHDNDVDIQLLCAFSSLSLNNLDQLAHEEPQVFILGYTRLCNVKPRIINTLEEKEFWEKQGHPVMVFPKYPMDGFRQRMYVSTDNTHKYIGLVRNRLKNKTIFKGLPCCFIKPQFEREKFIDLYNGIDCKVQVSERIIVVNNKKLYPGQLGELPRHHKNYLFVCDDNNTPGSPYRMGVSSQSSFISCVMFALSLSSPLSPEELRLKWSNSPLDIQLCRQEMYDYTPEEISTLLCNEKESLDPTLFIHLLEVKFKCTIVLFSSDENITMEPRFQYIHYRFVPFKTVVLIYVNGGDRCELIVWKGTTAMKTCFNENDVLYQNVISTMVNSKCYLHKKKRVKPLHFPDSIIENVTHCFIDYAGKNRCIRVDGVNIFTEPTPPIGCVEDSRHSFNERVTMCDVDNFMKKYHNVVKQSSLSSSSLPSQPPHHIPIMIGNVCGYIRPMVTLQLSSAPLSLFRRNRRLARILIEYTLYMYSIVLSQCEMTVTKFLQRCTTVDVNFMYDLNQISELFSVNGLFNKDGKLVYPSTNVQERMEFILDKYGGDGCGDRLQTEFVSNFYKHTCDFDDYTLLINTI